MVARLIMNPPLHSEKLYLFSGGNENPFSCEEWINAACEHKFIDGGNLFIDNTLLCLPAKKSGLRGNV
jgi:hypothetical protein